jgi:outer membrane protein assembly factor BamA
MRLLFFIFLFNFSLTAFGQQKMPIERIEITGNTKTKYYIILRELSFVKGDSLNAQQLGAAITVSYTHLRAHETLS